MGRLEKKGRRIYSAGFHAESNFFPFITSNVDFTRARTHRDAISKIEPFIYTCAYICFKEPLRFFHKKGRRSFPREEMKRLISILSYVIKLFFLKTNHEYVDTWVPVILIT